MSKKVITFGELMLRLVPEGYDRFIQADQFDASYGGAEANVAISLANFGIASTYVTKLPEHEIGQAALNSLRRYGVNTTRITRGGDRMGIYFLEKGASQRPSKVIYDRAGSSFAKAAPEDFDWERIFDGADWFHFSGITPALGDSMAEICLQACKAAKERNITISCDLNYRSNLWSKEKAARIMSGLYEYADVCITSQGEVCDIFGIEAADDSYESVITQVTVRFGVEKVVFTMRESLSADDNDWSALYYDGSGYYFSKRYHIHIVDRVGGGDAFAGGLIYALLQEFDPQKAIDFAASACCLKHSITGDYNLVSAAEVLQLAKGDASVRIQR